MQRTRTQAIVAHYERRHEFRGNFFGDQPFANYGYWRQPGLDFERAAAALTDVVAKAAGMRADDRILDVGCGYGAGAVQFVRQYNVACVVGVDATPVRIAAGNDYVASHGLSERIELLLGDATMLDAADNSFDRLTSVECAFHFDTRVDFMREAARVLRPGGTLALTDIIPRRGIDPREYMTGERATYSGVCLDMPANAYDADLYATHLISAGFENVRIESILKWTRLPFVRALRSPSCAATGGRAKNLERIAKRNQALIDLGEDYVLVTARRPELARGGD